uniref:Uncharacterized protein n=1 Tax=Populus davidiana TaxID=266767 RepID=A0A6M2EX12_9ROSI
MSNLSQKFFCGGFRIEIPNWLPYKHRKNYASKIPDVRGSLQHITRLAWQTSCRRLHNNFFLLATFHLDELHVSLDTSSEQDCLHSITDLLPSCGPHICNETFVSHFFNKLHCP